TSRFAGTTDGPSAEADLANFGAGSAEYAVVHVRVSRFWFLVSRSLALTPLGGPRTGAPRLHSGQAKHAPRRPRRSFRQAKPRSFGSGFPSWRVRLGPSLAQDDSFKQIMFHSDSQRMRRP